jgi:hypothetical protein
LLGISVYFSPFWGTRATCQKSRQASIVETQIAYTAPMENQARSNWHARSTKRITITIPASLFQVLEEASTKQGRSMSNLSAFLLEMATIAPKK